MLLLFFLVKVNITSHRISPLSKNMLVEPSSLFIRLTLRTRGRNLEVPFRTHQSILTLSPTLSTTQRLNLRNRLPRKRNPLFTHSNQSSTTRLHASQWQDAWMTPKTELRYLMYIYLMIPDGTPPTIHQHATNIANLSPRISLRTHCCGHRRFNGLIPTHYFGATPKPNRVCTPHTWS